MNKFIKTPLITNVQQLKGLRCGQWIQLAWSDKKSRFHHLKEYADGTVVNVTAFHFPSAVSQFNAYCRAK